MEIRHFLNAVLKKLWLIVILAIITTSAAVYYTNYMVVPIYNAYTTLYIISRDYSDPRSGVSFEEIRINSELIKDYKALIKSKKVTSAVINSLNISGITPEYVSKVTSVTLVEDSNVIRINVMDISPIRARDIANTLSTVFIGQMKELTNEDNIGIVDMADVPMFPINTSNRRYITMGFAAGIGFSLFLIYILEILNRKIRYKDTIETVTGYKVLAIIPSDNIK